MSSPADIFVAAQAALVLLRCPKHGGGRCRVGAHVMNGSLLIHVQPYTWRLKHFLYLGLGGGLDALADAAQRLQRPSVSGIPHNVEKDKFV